MVEELQQCRFQAPVAGGSGLMSGARWTWTILGFWILGGSVVGFGRSSVYIQIYSFSECKILDYQDYYVTLKAVPSRC